MFEQKLYYGNDYFYTQIRADFMNKTVLQGKHTVEKLLVFENCRK